MVFDYQSRKDELRRRLQQDQPSFNFDQQYDELLGEGKDVRSTEYALLTLYYTSDINNKRYTHRPKPIGESSTQETSNVHPQTQTRQEPHMTTPAAPAADERDAPSSSLNPLSSSLSDSGATTEEEVVKKQVVKKKAKKKRKQSNKTYGDPIWMRNIFTGTIEEPEKELCEHTPNVFTGNIKTNRRGEKPT